MVDMHSHILPFVDDGSDSLKSSVNLIKEELKNDVDKIIVTPHHKKGHYIATIEKIKESFSQLDAELKKENLNANLYLGQEIYVSDDVYEDLKSGEVLTINNTKCILIEFNYFVETDIQSYVHNLILLGYTPIIAHIERYTYLDWNVLYDLKMLGALIQVNATCLVGLFGRKIQKSVLKAIKAELIDFVASDIHSGRLAYMKKAYQKVCKFAGKELADKVFKLNAEKYFNI